MTERRAPASKSPLCDSLSAQLMSVQNIDKNNKMAFSAPKLAREVLNRFLSSPYSKPSINFLFKPLFNPCTDIEAPCNFTDAETPVYAGFSFTTVKICLNSLNIVPSEL